MAREKRVVAPVDPVQGPPLASARELAAAAEPGRFRKGAFAAGAAVGAAAATAVARVGRGGS